MFVLYDNINNSCKTTGVQFGMQRTGSCKIVGSKTFIKTKRRMIYSDYKKTIKRIHFGYTYKVKLLCIRRDKINYVASCGFCKCSIAKLQNLKQIQNNY